MGKGIAEKTCSVWGEGAMRVDRGLRAHGKFSLAKPIEGECAKGVQTRIHGSNLILL